MKYSVLLPTRNGLKYLQYAVASVLQQNYQDLEVVISDNASEEDIRGYVQSLGDPRVKYSRTETLLSVTENWNRCLDLSSGEYVIMLGDDDILLKRYFEKMDKLLEENHLPDLIYTNSYLFAYPNVVPNFPKGAFHPFGGLHAMPKHEDPFILDFSFRLEMVKEFLKFNVVYATNMQHVLMHRLLIEKLKREGRFFHSPYPDFYVMSVLFIEAKKVLICPKEMVVIGITSKSHGYYYYNKKTKEGIDFLNIRKEIALIPGLQNLVLPPFDNSLTFWFSAIYLVEKYFSTEDRPLIVDYKKYKLAQIDNILQSFYQDKKRFKLEYGKLMEMLSFSERLLVYKKFLSSFVRKKAPRFLKTLYQGFKQVDQTAISVGSPNSNFPENRYANALEIFEQVCP